MAKDIIESNQYMTLATVTEVGHPWVSPVVYALDGSYNLYYMSLPTSSHSKNIMKDSRVSLAIFDSRQNFGEGVGLQIVGKVNVVPVKATMKMFKYYFGREWPYGNLVNVKDFKKFFSVYKYRFYKVTPSEIWLNDPRREYDARVKVSLKLNS